MFFLRICMNGYRARRSVLLDYDSESGGSEAAARSPAKVEDGYTLLCEHSLRPVAQVPSIGNIPLTNTFCLRVSWVCTYVCMHIYMCVYVYRTRWRYPVVLKCCMLKCHWNEAVELKYCIVFSVSRCLSCERTSAKTWTRCSGEGEMFLKSSFHSRWSVHIHVCPLSCADRSR